MEPRLRASAWLPPERARLSAESEPRRVIAMRPFLQRVNVIANGRVARGAGLPSLSRPGG